MPRTILCSTGTFIAQGTKAMNDFRNGATHWEDEVAELRTQIDKRIEPL
jgi:hypothetical protein